MTFYLSKCTESKIDTLFCSDKERFPAHFSLILLIFELPKNSRDFLHIVVCSEALMYHGRAYSTRRQLIVADAPRADGRGELPRIKAASDRFAIRFVITSGVRADRRAQSSLMPLPGGIVVSPPLPFLLPRDTPRRAFLVAVSVRLPPAVATATQHIASVPRPHANLG